MGRLERKCLAHYIDANMGELMADYIRIGKDLDEYSDELNPSVNVQRNLVGEPNVVFEGYEVESKVEHFYADPDDGLFETLIAIANGRLTDDECRTTKVDVLYDGEGNQLWAYREDCVIVPTSVGGDTSGVQIPFNVYCEGNRVYGSFNESTLQFTASGEPEPTPGGIIPLSVTRNDTYVAPDKKAYSPVVVNVPSNYDVSEVTFEENGRFTAPEGEAYDIVNVDVPIGGAVDSVNGKTGAVELDKTDIGLGNVDNVQQYSANNPPPYPVTSVNGEMGDVTVPSITPLDIYPVGSIYMSVNSTDPGTLFGGTWEQIEDRFLLGAGAAHTAGDTGGEAAHTLDLNEMPTHNHDLSMWVFSGGAQSSGYRYGIPHKGNPDGGRRSISGVDPNGQIPWGVYSKGGGQAHNNMPPYLAVYIWKRTA